jgi:NitT/TauT family transport system substrate-binding protein
MRILPRLLVFALVLVGLPLLASAKVKVGVSDWPGWVAWYVAEQQGFFKKHGADVELVWFPNYTDSIQALSAGQLDANSQTWSDTLAPLAKRVPVKLILVNDNSAGNDALMARPEIKGFEDLRGKTVALEQFSVSHFVLVTALVRHQMTQDDVQLVNLLAGDAAAAFLGGKVDAVVVWNPWVNQIQTSGKGRPLFTSKEMPGLVVDALVAREKSIKEKRKDFLGMIRAWYDTERFIREHPDEAAKIMSKVVGLEAGQYKASLPGTRFFGQEDNLEAFGPKSEPKSLVAVGPVIAKFLRDNKLLEGEVDFAKGIDGSLVREVAGKK